LEVPWAGVITPSGDLFFTERNGRIRILRNDSLIARPLATLEIRRFDEDWKPENGLTGITLSPDFATSGHVFVLAAYERRRSAIGRLLYSRVVGRVRGLFRAPVWEYENRLLRLHVVADTATLVETLLGGMPTNHYHAGGFLHAGPDGMLYLSVGDGTYPRTAQAEKVLAGKILRVRPDGNTPATEQAKPSVLFASGLRNSQGMAWHSESGSMFAIDHGPTGMPRENYRVGNDELNVVVPGANFGWPDEGGHWGNLAHTQPIRVWGHSIAPSGIVSLPTGDADRAELIVSALGQQSLRWLTLARDAAVWRVKTEREFLRGQYGRLRLLALAPDGSLYVGTSNKDGRGIPRIADDLVLRVVLTAPDIGRYPRS
jgi:glucose/arabinose dehydrogenase